MYSQNKGITLITLVVTIVILGIIVGITIQGAGSAIEDTKENKLWSELEMVQHAIVERYTKYKLTKDSELLVGEITEPEELNGASWKLTKEQIGENVEMQYRKLTGTYLNQLGLKSGDSNLANIYIVNYYTGEVYNSTRQRTNKGELLYISIE